MKENLVPLYPNKKIAKRVTDYALAHSTELSPRVTEHHTWGLDEEKAVMMISPLQSKFQIWLAKALGVKRVLEVGCFIGYSATTWSEAVGPDGHVTSLEISETYAGKANQDWEKLGVRNCEVLVGNAAESLAQLASSDVEPYDLVFLDADKENYSLYLDILCSESHPGAARRLIRPGGVIVADNVLRRGLVADSGVDNPWSRFHNEFAHPELVESEVSGLQHFNRLMLEHPRIETFMLPLFDGLSLGRLVD